MKIYINKPKESWVVDRFIDEWKFYNKNSYTSNILFSDIVWIIAPWTWKKINKSILKKKKVICTIHHIDKTKFDEEEQENFRNLEEFVDCFHVISTSTYEQVSKYSNKKIYTAPFWANKKLWFEIKDKELLRKKYSLNGESFYVGSFQRDTEGHDLKSLKLSKGPDQFVEIVKTLKKDKKNLEVLLTGKRRQYLINELTKNKIPYKYYEMADFTELNELYNCLDLYIVASRIEGGPQSILESALTNTPIISTNVGIASEILHSDAIFNMDNYKKSKPNNKHASKKVEKYTIPSGFNKFNEMFTEVYES